jgi:ribosomal-protein-alanine N-acetyltransferase
MTVHVLPLKTARLRLRAFVPEAAADQRFIMALLNDPAWIANIGKREVSTCKQAGAYLRDGPAAMLAHEGFGLLMVESAADGTPMGMCGLIKRDTLPDVDIGFAFLPPYRSQGFAREAAAAVLGWAQALGIARVIAIVTPTNAPSLGLLRRLGFADEGSTVHNGETLCLLARSLTPG